jgi:hypothetical protein
MTKYVDRAKQRIEQVIRKFGPILQRAEQAGANEADTSAIVADILSEMLGYDRYTEVTRQFMVRGKFADFAVKPEGQLLFFVEVKAVRHRLREDDLFQVISYTTQHGLEWMVLTNGRVWQCYRMSAPGKVDRVFEVDLMADEKTAAERMYLLSREGFRRGALRSFWLKADALSPVRLAGAILSPPVLRLIRRVLYRMTRRKVEVGELKVALKTGVLRGDLVDELKDREGEMELPVRRRARAKLGPQCFAYVPDPTQPSTWKLPYRKPDGSVDEKRLGAAVAAISPGGYRGRRVEIPPEHLPEVKRRLAEAYEEIGKPIPEGLLGPEAAP